MVLPDDLWMMLYDALGIGRPAEPATLATLLLVFSLALLAGMAIGKFVAWLPDAIKWLLSSAFEILGGIIHLLLWRTPEDKEVELRDEEAGKEDDEETEDEVETDFEEEPEKELPEKPRRELDGNFYLERELTSEEREKLLGLGYKRLKTSPFGDSGASYYLVRKRWNESAEHAFFCWLIESLLKERGRKVNMFVNNGPDIVFKRADKGKEYCIDIETGSNLARDREKVRKKFEYYAQQYHRSYIFVTNKKLKRKYRKFGIVITRASLSKVLT